MVTGKISILKEEILAFEVNNSSKDTKVEVFRDTIVLPSMKGERRTIFTWYSSLLGCYVLLLAADVLVRTSLSRKILRNYSKTTFYIS